MGDRAEVSHQLRTSDDHSLRLGSRADGARLSDRLRASGVDRCGYSGGPAPEVRGRLFVLMAGPWLLGRGCVGRRRHGERGGLCECSAHGRDLGAGGCTPRVRGHFLVAGDNLVRAGAFDAVGDGNPVPERVGCPRLERIAPGRAECPRRRRGCGCPWSPRKLAIGTSPAGPRWGGAREPGWKTWDERGAHPRKILTSDKPDLFLVHLRSVQGSGILRGNRSTSYSGRRISDRSGRPSVAVHQSNRQGRSRAPSSGQVRDDVPRGDQGSSGQ